MKAYLKLLPILFFILIFTSCKKDKCKGGSGGNLTIVTKTIHHTRPIPGCTVYVKYNTSEFPGEDITKYDASYKVPDSAVEIAITGLQCGDYYFYAYGIDSLLDPSNNIVKGGIPYSTNSKEGVININVPITEGD